MARQQSQAQRNRSAELVWVRGSTSFTYPASTSSVLHNFSTVLDAALGETARNWTIERIIGQMSLTVPAATAAGRSYSAYTAIDVLEGDAVTAGAVPEPFADNESYPWVDGRRVFADHTVPASYAGFALNGTFVLDMRSKRRAKGLNQKLVMFGYHDNGLAANPTAYLTYSALFRLHA